ncbi:hypothetical protein EV361DRAFT_969934 [Lentinula raphanica]|uniref:Uncharacterized protein n=1 Tax=Lentinula raphanica TaxID=153919 RepID=A0AA38UEN9_9AGAR|nr:hypothetical protein C8R42DRAFT_684826 [Lentinula raphanica]KAJ3823925.1 hypothetical protein F5880DRAFT_1563805 [Lentinula raphanica]KAJ3838531.1 hypothetical protein F5878DRAFT_652028 [Lentinula raphanica]KAJ3974310.1 hypothetical protein EV361DRAFT_969934 [Lentinula raphanica]
MLLPTTLFFLSWSSAVLAGSANFGDSCSVSNNRLQVGTYQFYTDCNSVTYCASNGTCAHRGCRKDDFPFGYPQGSDDLPPKCGKGQFCPDEMDACLDVLPVGSACQMNRDDQCQGPPNYKDLLDTTNRGLNVNGSLCLNNVCMWANVTENEDCVVQNTAYIGYTASGGEFIDIVSRGNCRVGLYCDAQSLKCLQEKDLGEACDADKECSTWNCLSSGVCGPDQALDRHVSPWVYVVVGISIVAGMFGTLIGLFFLHVKQRDAERERRLQYWREQNTFHQNLSQMREAARTSITGMNSAHSTFYGGNNSDDSHAPMLRNTSGPSRAPSGLRNYVGDGEDYEESVVMQQQPVQPRRDLNGHS